MVVLDWVPDWEDLLKENWTIDVHYIQLKQQYIRYISSSWCLVMADLGKLGGDWPVSLSNY